MTIITDLAQSLILRELGAPQDSYFCWELLNGKLRRGKYNPKCGYVAAYTLSELLEWTVSRLGNLQIESDNVTSYASCYATGSKESDPIHSFGGDSPIDALMNLITSVMKGKE